MAARVALSQCLRQLAMRPSAFIAFSKSNSNSVLLKFEGNRLTFAQSFSKTSEENPAESSEEADPNVVVDAKEASKMRSRIIPVEVSMRYLKSNGKYLYDRPTYK